MMPAKKRFVGTMNCHIPPPIRAGVLEVARRDGMSQSEAMRRLLETGLRVRGIMAMPEAAR